MNDDDDQLLIRVHAYEHMRRTYKVRMDPMGHVDAVTDGGGKQEVVGKELKALIRELRWYVKWGKSPS